MQTSGSSTTYSAAGNDSDPAAACATSRSATAHQPSLAAPLAKARIAAHSAFDPLWQSGKMTRTAAYSELARRLGIPKRQAHMQMFDIATCERVVQMFLVDEFETLDDDFGDLV